MELSPGYKNKWANKWNSYWFYVTILVVGRNEQNEEIISFDLASEMKDLEVHLAPELTKSSQSSSSTSTYFQATHVITTRDALEEFVVAEIWLSKLHWGFRGFTLKKLPGLDDVTKIQGALSERQNGPRDSC